MLSAVFTVSVSSRWFFPVGYTPTVPEEYTPTVPEGYTPTIPKAPTATQAVIHQQLMTGYRHEESDEWNPTLRIGRTGWNRHAVGRIDEC